MSVPSRRRSVALVVVPLLGLAALVAGVVIQLSTPVSFGWFAYAPLSEATFVAPGLLTQFGVGPILTGVGIALLAGWAGFLLGRRRRGPSS